jgi:hypothetical protein
MYISFEFHVDIICNGRSVLIAKNCHIQQLHSSTPRYDVLWSKGNRLIIEIDYAVLAKSYIVYKRLPIQKCRLFFTLV